MEKYIILSKINAIHFLCGIFTIGLVFRLFYFDYTVPLILDSLSFFTYSADIATMGKLPENYDIAKPGWSYFLGIIFSIFNFEHTMQYMQLQKLLAISISSLTIFPIFFLIKKFFPSKYALLGVLLFALDPRIMQNSLNGNSEPLFIFCIATTILLFLNKNHKIIYFSFLLAGIAALIRPEGLFLFFGISISYFIRFRKNRFLILKYILGLLLFILILAPVSLHKQQDGMYEPVYERAYNVLFNSETYDAKSRENTASETSSINSLETKPNIFILGLEHFFKYLVWVLIPLFILVTPVGFIIFFKFFNMDKLTIILLTIMMSIPAFYAYTFPFLETKYLYFLFPILCIFAASFFKFFFEKFNKDNLLFVICFVLIISSSLLFINLKFDFQKEHESTIIADYVVKNTKVINNYYPESLFIVGLDVKQNWKEYEQFYKKADRTIGLSGDIKTNQIYHPSTINIIEPSNYDSLESFLFDPLHERISHLVVDGKNDRPEFLNKIFYEENKYPYLNKIYDSHEHNLSYHVKVFEIDYNKINNYLE
tara:strand:+ start:21 stop:1640 length:1620 start_codon:yes stop_codon:yes gene_type:complete